MKRFLILFKSLFKELFLTSKDSVFWLTIFPTILFLILTSIFGNMERNVQFRVKILGKSEMLENVLNKVQQMNVEFIPDYSQETLNALKLRLEEDNIDVILVLPNDFDKSYSTSLLLKETTLFRQIPVELYDVRLRQSSAIASDVMKGIFGSMDVSENVKYEVHNPFGEQYDYNNFIYPGIVGMMIMSVFLCAFMSYLIYFRRKKILRKISTTPISMITVYLTTAAVNLIALIIGLCGLSVVAYFLGVDVITYLPSMIVHTLIACSVLTMITLVVMTFSSNPSGLFVFQQIFLQIQMFAGGFYFPLKVLTPFIRKFANFLPLTYTVDGIRSAKGLNSLDTNYYIVPLIYLALSTLIVSLRSKKLTILQ